MNKEIELSAKEEVRRSNAKFSANELRMMFPDPNCESRKLNQKKVKGECKALVAYGSLNVCQTIINRFLNEGYQSQDEIIGDLSEILDHCYKDIKKNLKLLTLKEYGIEQIFEYCQKVDEHRRSENEK